MIEYIPCPKKKAAAGFAPANSGFADRRLATWLYRLVVLLLG